MSYDPNQPRDPKGSPTGGEWTIAGIAARKAAGLGIDPDIGKAVSAFHYKNFSSLEDKEKYVREYVKTIAQYLGYKVDCKILSDKEFDAFVDISTKRMGISPREIEMLSARVGGVPSIYLRARTVSSIYNENSFRLFAQNVDHEIAHGYHRNVLGEKPDFIKTMEQYEASSSEDFANVFGSRLSMLRQLMVTGKTSSKVLANATDYVKWLENR